MPSFRNSMFSNQSSDNSSLTVPKPCGPREVAWSNDLGILCPPTPRLQQFEWEKPSPQQENTPTGGVPTLSADSYREGLRSWEEEQADARRKKQRYVMVTSLICNLLLIAGLVVALVFLFKFFNSTRDLQRQLDEMTTYAETLAAELDDLPRGGNQIC